MRFVVLAILLAMPVVDVYITARVARWTGVPLWVWLTGSFLAGLLLLRSERTAFRTRTVAALHGEQALLRGLLDSGRKVLAAFLLIIPGVVTDLVALMLLALPLNVGHGYRPQPASAGRWPRQGSNFDSLDGDFRRVD
jgi:UPF0716 protein FxsA